MINHLLNIIKNTDHKVDIQNMALKLMGKLGSHVRNYKDEMSFTKNQYTFDIKSLYIETDNFSVS